MAYFVTKLDLFFIEWNFVWVYMGKVQVTSQKEVFISSVVCFLWKLHFPYSYYKYDLNQSPVFSPFISSKLFINMFTFIMNNHSLTVQNFILIAWIVAFL